MIICTDRRETEPLTFAGYDVEVMRGRKDTGYTLLGHESQVVVVRWSLRDVTTVHEGFLRRCRRLSKMPVSAVVFYDFQDTPDDVRKAYVAAMARCSIPCHFAEDPELFIYTFLSSYLRRAAR